MSKRKIKQRQHNFEKRDREQKEYREELRKSSVELNERMRKIFSAKQCITEELLELIFKGKEKQLEEKLRFKYAGLIGAYKRSSHNESSKKLRALLKHFLKYAPKLLDERYWSTFRKLADIKWIRVLEEWRPTGKGVERQFDSLVKHLAVKYQLPKFIYSILEMEEGDNYLQFFSYVATGGSVYKAVLNNLLPFTLTKKMCHLLMGVTAEKSIYEAVRISQVLASGGTIELANAICASKAGRECLEDEPFWYTVIQWFCNQSEVDLVQVAPLIDYIEHRKEEDCSYKITGRSYRALISQMEEWHLELARVKRLIGVQFTASGFYSGSWQKRVRLKDGNYTTTHWRVREILTSKELLAEGRAMHHCVYSYASYIEKRRTSIWSLTSDEARHLTVEVDNKNRSIVQARGKYNRMPNSKELEFLKKWSHENRLELKI